MTRCVDGDNRRLEQRALRSSRCGRTANREANERASTTRSENHTRTTRYLVALWRPDVERAVLGAASHAYRPAAPPIGGRPLPRMQGTTALIRDGPTIVFSTRSRVSCDNDESTQLIFDDCQSYHVSSASVMRTRPETPRSRICMRQHACHRTRVTTLANVGKIIRDRTR